METTAPISPPQGVENDSQLPSEQRHESQFSNQPPPLLTEAKQLPENLKVNHDSPNSNQSLSLLTPPSPLPSTLPIAVEDNVETPNHNHESLVSKQFLSPSPSPSQTGVANDLDRSSIDNVNSCPNHESPNATQPTSPLQTVVEDPVQSPNYHQNPSPNYHKNLSPNHESPNATQPPSPPPPPPQIVVEDAVQSPNYHENPSPNYHKNLSPNHDTPNSKQLQSTLPSAPSIGAEDHVENTVHINPSPETHGSPENLSPSPPLTAVSPSSPHDTPELTTPPLGIPLYLDALVGSAPSRPPISPWTPEETSNLIQAYQEKWYSLKKGPLKAGQWEEVAITVAARCGYDEPTKTAKQCRHKIEKLRKRYRAERGKPRSKANGWNFFKLMDNMERGPFPISSSQPTALVEYEKPSDSNNRKRKNEEFAGDGEFLVNRGSSSRVMNSNHHVVNGGLGRNIQFPERIVRGLRTPTIHKRKEFYQEQRDVDDDDEEEEERGVGGNKEEVGVQLAAEIKSFAEKFVKMENKKIEMIRDVERYRLEMENKRVEMILESQQMLVETVNNAFS
ncbi:uncharacterized protein [Rutidosis leptorrhynchoides]|uniref:uncharacterized protein n=1 Tax=Rutidosis leptorrhynchoides TaxID=125765 RepID=UPI003A98E04F